MSELKESIKRGSKVEKELYLIRYSGRDYLTKSNVYFFVDEEDNLSLGILLLGMFLILIKYGRIETNL